MTQPVLLLLIVYAACGLALSLLMHIQSFWAAPAGEGLFFALHLGIFPMWFAAIALANKAAPSGFSPLKPAEGIARWMQVATTGFFIYGVISFFLFPEHGHHPSGAPPDKDTWRVFSGGWMIFYSAGLMMLTETYRSWLSGPTPK